MSDFINLTIKYLPEILRAALFYTIPLTIISFTLAIIFAVITAVIRIMKLPKSPIIRWLTLIIKSMAAFMFGYFGRRL